MNELLLKGEAVAERLQLGRSKVYLMMARGELPVIRIGKSVRVPARALERWIEQQMEGAGCSTGVSDGAA